VLSQHGRNAACIPNPSAEQVPVETSEHINIKHNILIYMIFDDDKAFEENCINY